MAISLCAIEDDGHPPRPAQPLAATQEIEPPSVRLDPAFAEARVHSILSKAAIGADRSQDQRLELVEAVEDDGLVFVRPRLPRYLSASITAGELFAQAEGGDL